MKKLLLIIFAVLVVWHYFSKTTSTPKKAVVINKPQTKSIQKIKPRFKCDGREYCGQMNSRAEAVFFIRNCPNTKMDGDHDGIPCENDSRF